MELGLIYCYGQYGAKQKDEINMLKNSLKWHKPNCYTHKKDSIKKILISPKRHYLEKIRQEYEFMLTCWDNILFV